MAAPLHGMILDCACGLRYMRGTTDLALAETGQAYCVCRRMLGTWQGPIRLTFDPEDPLSPTTPA